MHDTDASHPIERPEQASEPFAHERDVVYDVAATHDDISATQTDARAAARISGEHESGLLYEPGYIVDPRGADGGVLYYPSEEVSGATPEEQSG